MKKGKGIKTIFSGNTHVIRKEKRQADQTGRACYIKRGQSMSQNMERVGEDGKTRKNFRKKLKNQIAWITGLCAGLLVLMFMTGMHREEVKIQQEIAACVVRFHVKANSDRKQDQENKLAVRDALLEKMEALLGENPDRQKTEEILRENLPQLQLCAEEALQTRDCDQPVKVTFGEAWFPQKTYGEYTLPSGKYEALNVTIGGGAGHNWWCMVYPSLCFPDALHPVPDEEGEQALETILSDEAYDSILRHGKLRFSFFLAIFGHSG